MKNIEETIGNLIDKQSVSFISSIDENGYPSTRAMLTPVKREGIKTIYWHTNSLSMKIKQYRHNPKACVYFCEEHSFQGVMLKGIMEILNDKEIKKEIRKDLTNWWINIYKNNRTAPTSHNRTVYAAPPIGGLASIRLGHSATLHSHASLRHILPALVFAVQSPYTGWQNVVNSRNVMCNAP